MGAGGAGPLLLCSTLLALPTVHTGDFGRYTLQRLLARGGMGEVHLARLQGAAGWEKEVVVKRLLPHLMDDPEFVARFLDEARIAVTLSHGNIVPVFDMGEVEGSYFLAMEYVDGWDVRAVLRHVQRQGQTVPVGLALFIAAEVCRGLAYAHQRTDGAGAPLGIVHRDISPSNILLSRDGDVKVTDFGIALARSRAVQTLTGQLKGKLAYMSPEQARGQTVDQRSDLYALGLVLFEMISGQRVYDAGTDVEILARVGRGERLALVEVMPDIDPEVAAVVERALQTDASMRYPDADAMQVDLMRVLFRETGPVTGRQLASWLLRIAPPREAPGAGAARLDDLLLANLATGGQTPTSMPTPGLRPTGTLTVAPRLPHEATSDPLPAVFAATPAPRPAERQTPATSSAEVAPVPAAPRRAGQRFEVLLGLVAAIALVVGITTMLRAPAQYEVISVPDGASVYIDGAPVGVTRLLTDVLPGSRTIRVALPGYEPWTAQLEAGRGEQLLVEAVLQREAVSASIESVPAGATVEIVGEPGVFAAGTSRRFVPDVPVQLRLTLPGYLPHEETWTPSGPAPRLTVRLEPEVVVASVANAAQVADAGTEAAAVVQETPPNSAGTAPPEPREVERAPTTGDDRSVRPPRTTPEVAIEPVAGPPGGVRLFFPDTPMVGELFVDGRTMGRVESGAEFALPAGSYALEVRNDPNQKRHGARVEVRPGEVTRHDVRWER